MKNRIKKLSLIFGLIGLAMVAYADPIVMGYYENWDTYQNYPISGNGQKIANPDLDAKLTGINTLTYAFLEIMTPLEANLANIPADQQAQYLGDVRFSDAWSDINTNNSSDSKFCSQLPFSCGAYIYNQNKYVAWPTSSGSTAYGNFQAFVNANVKNHFVSIGGSGHDDGWQAAFANPQNFVNSVKALVETYGVNGIDMDYEPSAGIIPSTDAALFVNLVQQLHQALPGLTLAWPIVPNANLINSLTTSQWQTIGQNISYISIMGYDMTGEFTNPAVTGLQSALLSVNPGDFNDDSIVKALNNVGISNSQIILGVPLYGRAVGGVKTAGLSQPFTLAVQGDLDSAACSTSLGLNNSCGGLLSYTSLLKSAYTPTEVHVGQVDVGAYSYDAAKQMFVSYDSPQSITEKANYVINNHLAGIMVWALRFDTATNDSNSLLAALDKPFGISPQPPQPGPAPTQGQVIVVNNNSAGISINHALNVILQEGSGALYQAPTVTVGNILANPSENSVLETPGAFGAYNGPLSIWIQDTAVSGSKMLQCSKASVNYSQTGKQITINVVGNGNNVDCASWYSN